MRERRQELKRLQRSVRVFSDIAATRPRSIYGETYYSRMLVDDASIGLVPYSRTEDITVTIEPANGDFERIVAEGIAREGHYWDLLGAVRDFLRDATHTLLGFGRAPYEIVYYSETATRKIVGFELSFIAPWTLKPTSAGWVQTIPTDYAEHVKKPSRIEFPPEFVVCFRLPRSIDRYFTRMMKDLEVLGGNLYPTFGMPAPGSSQSDVGFEFQTWQRSREIAVAQATRECGWNGRGSFVPNITEFYSVYRFLKFERVKLALRSSILSQLNDVLITVGERLGLEGRIVTRGLPDSEQIDKSFEDLESGVQSLTDVMKPYLRV